MGEIFKRERPSQHLAFSGERLTGAVSGQIEIEHWHRYLLAREMARGLDVLEIACGEGYGAALLAQVARSVLAMDVSAEAVGHAARNYAAPNLRFRQGDTRRLDVPDASVDLLTSFETLEHFFEHEAFYAEARRVLRPGGKLLISTPDRDAYSPDGSAANRFHVRELTRAEFETGLRRVFPKVQLLVQRPMIGSLLMAATPGAAAPAPVTWEQRGPDFFERNDGLPRGLYLVAVASDAEVSVPVVTAYIETSQLALREAEAANRLAEKEAKSASLAAQLIRAQAEAARSRAEATQLRAQAETDRAERDHALHLRRHAEERLEAILGSTSWRMTAPLRRLLGRAPAPAQQPAPSPAPVPAPAPEPAPAPFTPLEAQVQGVARGLHLPAAPTRRIAVGIVTYDSDAEGLRRCAASAAVALRGVAGAGRILLIDNGTDSPPLPETEKLPGQGNIGFGRAHNALMRQAFADGADLYVAANPDGAFHPDALAALARMDAAQEGRALIEACQFPAEHPKAFDAATLETPWASGACLAIPRAVFEATGGFDDIFFMYCEDVDLSWRVRAMGMKVLIAPDALFLHAVTNRDTGPAMRRMMLESGVLLGRKWGASDFAEAAAAELAALGAPVPGLMPPQVPEAWRSVPDFSRHFSFAPVRW